MTDNSNAHYLMVRCYNSSPPTEHSLGRASCQCKYQAYWKTSAIRWQPNDRNDPATLSQAAANIHDPPGLQDADQETKDIWSRCVFASDWDMKYSQAFLATLVKSLNVTAGGKPLSADQQLNEASRKPQTICFERQVRKDGKKKCDADTKKRCETCRTKDFKICYSVGRVDGTPGEQWELRVRDQD